jgi:DNA modification methylase
VNLVRRYTRPGELVVDPMAGSGTISDVARGLGRRAVAMDLAPRRKDILRADARAWPLPDGIASLAIVDSPYSDNVAYSEDPRCLGRISCRDPRFYVEMARVIGEAHRVLRMGGVLAWIISDEYRGGVYTPVGFRLQAVLAESFELVDTVILVRHNDRSASPMWEHRARRFNFFLRGFKFLFIARRPLRCRGGIPHGERIGSDK